MLVHWFIGFNYREKLNRFASNKWALLIASIFLLHLVGLFYTSDFDYALRDIRIKIPLLALPFFIGSQERLNSKELRLVIFVFIAAVLTGTIASIYKLMGIPEGSATDQRHLSVFISHIRFSLMICLAVFFSACRIPSEKTPLKIVFAVVVVWLMIFLFITAFFTGLVVFTITASALLFVFLFRQKKTLPRIMALLFIAALIIIPVKIISDNLGEYFSYHPVESAQLDDFSKGGERYFHDTTGVESRLTENGNYIWRYIAWKELKRSWNRKSDFDFEGKDQKGQSIRGTLVRYMTSKGLRKDSVGLQQLTERDIRAVEKGVANEKYLDMSAVDVRIQQIIWEFDNYRKGDEFNGHSVVMRWVYWNTAYQIIRDHFWIGTGTGDIDRAFKEKYDEVNSGLDEKWRLRAHNQFLTIFATFGVIGFLWFIIALFLPFFALKKWRNWYYLSFIIIAVLSMITEDTLETQAGVTFFAFWNTLLLIGRKDRL